MRISRGYLASGPGVGVAVAVMVGVAVGVLVTVGGGVAVSDGGGVDVRVAALVTDGATVWVTVAGVLAGSRTQPPRLTARTARSIHQRLITRPSIARKDRSLPTPERPPTEQHPSAEPTGNGVHQGRGRDGLGDRPSSLACASRAGPSRAPATSSASSTNTAPIHLR